MLLHGKYSANIGKSADVVTGIDVVPVTHTWNKKFPIGSLWIDSDAVDYDLLCFAYFVLILENIDDGLIKVLHENGHVGLMSKYSLIANYRRIEVLLHDS